MSTASTVQPHATEKFNNWISQAWFMQTDTWKKADERLGNEFAHGYTDFQETLDIQDENDKVSLAWAMFAMSILTAGAGTLISAALVEASVVKQLASSTDQTPAFEPLKEKMGQHRVTARPTLGGIKRSPRAYSAVPCPKMSKR